MADPNDSFWTLDPEVLFLNHGSFGACPRPVQEAQARVRARLEAEPVRFFLREYEPLLEEARAALAAFVGASPERLALVGNATEGVNAALRSFPLEAGDEVLLTDHGYGACANAARRITALAGARVVVASLPFPLEDPAQVVEAVLAAVTPRTRLALIDHITSPTALVLPVAELVAALRQRGVETIVDGAHGPGMVPLDLEALGAAFYTGNCHKWLCAPRGTALLHVREDLAGRLEPLVLSHGVGLAPGWRGRVRQGFDWPGTRDPSGWLALPTALEIMGAQLEGGWPALMARNRALALAGREALCAALGVEAPAPASMLGSMATVPIAPGPPWPVESPFSADPLHDALLDDHGIEVPIVAWPDQSRRWVRISAQLYNTLEDYKRLGAVLAELTASPQGL